MTNPTTEGQNSGKPSLSRREVLRRAGWVVPAVVALPLVATPAHAGGRRRTKYASPGSKTSYGSKSGSYSGSVSGSHDRNWSYGGFLNFFSYFK